MAKRIAVALAALAVLVFGTAAAVAQTTTDTHGAAESSETVVSESTAGSEEDIFFDDFDELTPEIVEEINAETDALVEHLRDLGFEVTVETADDGIKELVFDEDDEALWDALDEYYEAAFAAEVATWSDEDKTEWNAGIEEFVAELAELGIEVETSEIAPGVIDIVWTEELDDALWDLDEDIFFDDFDELTPEIVEEINAETDALVEHLRDLGFEVTVETADDGIKELVFDEDDEALWDALDEYYEAAFAAEVATWSDEDKTEWNAGIEEFVAELAELGIEVETSEIAPGVIDIVWTEELDDALWDLDEDIFFDHVDEPTDDQ